MNQTDHPAKYSTRRENMVQQQISARNVRSKSVLKAMRRVPRELFMSHKMREFAYEDSALPIEEGQTISQPYIVALMIEALQLRGGEHVLEVGAGSGYASAVLAEIAGSVVGIERIPALADSARRAIAAAGYRNINIICADGTQGYSDEAPYDAILVSAGGPDVPQTLLNQLAPGGRLVIPVGDRTRQRLLCVTREGKEEFHREELTWVRFVPLVGNEGWHVDSSSTRSPAGDKPFAKTRSDRNLSTEDLITAAADPFSDIESADLDPLMQRIGDSRVVLMGEASHGTSEFYRFRARLTRELIEHQGFSMVAVEADWPDAARIDHYVRDLTVPPSEWRAFTRFPTWMWRNTEVQDLVEWLRRYNARFVEHDQRVGFYGLDLYSMYNSIDEVLRYLEGVDAEAAEIARQRYACLTPWQSDPATYGRVAMSSGFPPCEDAVVETLMAIIEKQSDYSASADGEQFLAAVQNARLVANAEAYYRSMYEGHVDSWNLRDSHMFGTLCSLLDFKGPHSKIIVWAHNSHLGDARATSMAASGEHNLGQLCRQKFAEEVYSIGFGTHGGTVAAADNWGSPMQCKTIKPSLSGSWERLCHDTQMPAFMLGMRKPASRELRQRLLAEKPERAIGVIYRPQTEWSSHYFHARLGEQFDEYVWFDQSSAVTPLDTEQMQGMPETYPFGL